MIFSDLKDGYDRFTKSLPAHGADVPVVVNIGKTEITHMAAYEDEFSIKFSRFVNADNVAHIYRELNDAYNHISAYGYARIVLLDMSLKMVRYLHM